MNSVLVDFLARLEPDYRWHLLSCQLIEGHIQEIHLELTSQRWLEGQTYGVDHPLWQHRLSLFLPITNTRKPCLLMVNSGVRHDPSMETMPGSQVDCAALCRLT